MEPEVIASVERELKTLMEDLCLARPQSHINFDIIRNFEILIECILLDNTELSAIEIASVRNRLRTKVAFVYRLLLAHRARNEKVIEEVRNQLDKAGLIQLCQLAPRLSALPLYPDTILTRNGIPVWSRSKGLVGGPRNECAEERLASYLLARAASEATDVSDEELQRLKLAHLVVSTVRCIYDQGRGNVLEDERNEPDLDLLTGATYGDIDALTSFDPNPSVTHVSRGYMTGAGNCDSHALAAIAVLGSDLILSHIGENDELVVARNDWHTWAEWRRPGQEAVVMDAWADGSAVFRRHFEIGEGADYLVFKRREVQEFSEAVEKNLRAMTARFPMPRDMIKRMHSQGLISNSSFEFSPFYEMPACSEEFAEKATQNLADIKKTRPVHFSEIVDRTASKAELTKKEQEQWEKRTEKVLAARHGH